MRLSDAYMGTKNQFGELGLITSEPGGLCQAAITQIMGAITANYAENGAPHLTSPHQSTTSQQQQLHYNYFRHNVKVIFGRFLPQCICLFSGHSYI